MLIQLIKRSRLAVNPADITAMVIYSSNGYRVLEVRMRAGEAYRVHHQPECLDGDDIFQIHQQLLDAQ